MPDARPEVSVVVPVYGCRDCLAALHQRLVATLEGLGVTFEILLVNDASPDESWTVIRSLAAEDGRVRGLDLSRNFGQHYAISAGVDFARGEWVVVMDCDLQHAPEGIGALLAKAREGYDVVFSRRVRRKDGLVKRLSSRLFGTMLAFLTGRRGDAAISNFSIVSRKVADRFRAFRERNRSYPLMVSWLGFDTAVVDIEHAPRFAGESSYSWSRQITFAVETIVSQTDRPLRLSIRFGFALCVGSLLFGLYLAARRIFWAVPVAGWTSVIVSIYFVAGLLFANLGVLGLYVGRIFEETKGRPLYVVKRTVNLDPEAGSGVEREGRLQESRR